MTLATTASFTLTADTIMNLAQARIGGEQTAGYDAFQSRQLLQVMLTEWLNYGVNMWARDQIFLNMVQGTNSYPLPADTIDIAEPQGCIMRYQAGTVKRTSTPTAAFIATTSGSTTVTITDADNGATIGDWVDFDSSPTIGGITIPSQVNIAAITLVNSTWTFTASSAATATASGGLGVTMSYQGTTDLPMVRIAADEFDRFPAKYNQDRPILYFVDRVLPPTLYVQFTPATAPVGVYQVLARRKRQLKDVTTPQQTIDAPQRFFAAAIAGMAYYLGMGVPAAALQAAGKTVADLKQTYYEALTVAQDEDREPAPIRIEPDLAFLYR